MKSKQRTPRQNNSFHKLFRMYSDTLNEHGLTIPFVFQQRPEIDWTPEIVKALWHDFQKAKFGKKSTKDLTTKEVQEVYEEVNRFMSGFGLHIPFPSIEELLNQQRNEDT